MKDNIEFGFSKKDIDSFEKRLDKLFDDIKQTISDPKKYAHQVGKTRTGLRENREMLIENELQYARMKYDLKSRGLIQESTPLSVTGQLINDFSLELMKTAPDEINLKFGFENTPRNRPTYESMVEVYRGDLETFRFQSKGSEDIVKVLQNQKGYPITETIYKVYSKGYVNRVEKLISEAFKRT